jgi:hypothetical protein
MVRVSRLVHSHAGTVLPESQAIGVDGNQAAPS